MVSISGLGSGLDTQSIIAQLVSLEQAKINSVSARGQAQATALGSWTTIRGALTTFSGAAAGLLRSTDWQALAATSSNEAAVGVSAGAGTSTGAFTFNVTALAQTGMLRSSSTIASLATKVTSDAAILVAGGGGKLGFGSLASDATVTLGTHTIVVTQASAAATKAGSGALAATTTITGTNNTLNLTVNGAGYSLTVADGTYDASQLATAVQAAATAAGAAVNATVAGNGALQIATVAEGSAATLRVTGGSALGSLSLTTDAAALQGSDGQVTVDGGAAQTFGAGTAIGAGSTISLAAGAGTITAVLAGGLRAGTLTANKVGTGDGSLQSVVAAINGANAGVTAAAVQVGTNAFRLQLAGVTTGAGSDPNVAASALDATVVGGLTVLAAGTDAAITVGTGAGSYTITGATNTLSGVLPGLTMTLKQVTASPVTVSVDRNAAALADKVQKLVDAANGVEGALDKATAYDVTAKKAAPLTGDLTADRLRRALFDAIGTVVPGANPATAGLAGISVDKTGAYTFDRQKFLDAFAKDPDGMSKVFKQFGSATDAGVSFVNATDRTRAGTYAINVTQAAAQAFSSSGGAVAAGTTVRARAGGTVVAYTVQAGDTAATIAAGLNSAFAAQRLALVAGANGTAVEVRTAQYGSAATMDIAWDGTTYVTQNGTDVAGSINGVAATGRGQTLTAPSTDPTLAGLAIQVVGTATGALGTITYTPGVSARIAALVTAATDPVSGYITSSEAGIKATQDLITQQVDRMNQRLSAYEARLKAQFAQLETAMANLKNQQSWLAGQLGSLG